MNTEKLRTAFAGMVLSLLLSCGAVGCLLTGFGLSVENRPLLWLVCGGTALLCAAASLWKWGTTAVLCLFALWAGYLWHRGEAGQQILQLVYRLSYVYHRAYDWGYLPLTKAAWDAGFADLPLQILGCAIAATVCHTVCRGKRTWPAVALSLCPLFLCLVVTNTVPREGALFSLLLGVILLLLTASVRRLDLHQSGVLLLLLALPVTAVLAGLFRWIPQEGYVNRAAEVREGILSWVESLPEKVEDTTKEIASAVQISDDETVNLKTLGRQSSLAYPVMEVTSDWNGALYLRGQDYDSYTGTGWTAAPHRSEEFAYSGEAAASVEITTRNGWENRFLPYYPVQIGNLVGGSLANPDREKTYTVSRTILPDNWRSLVKERSQGIWDSEIAFTAALNAANYLDEARYLLLPLETQAKAKELLESVLDNQATATEKADAIAAYVRSSAKYDRDTGRMSADAEDFALWFLTESETGYCVHFATSAVVLLRAAGVPARYVTGYLAHCRSGETVTVTADTAHAWAEYYEPQLACWIPLEATPSDGLPTGNAPTENSSEASRATLPPESLPEQTEPSYSAPVREEPSAPGPQTSHQQPKKPLSLGWLWIFALIGAAAVQRPARIALRRRRSGTDPNSLALGYWQEIALLAKLRRQPPAKELRQLAQKAKFSQHTLTKEELAILEESIYDSVEQLKHSPWYLRLLYRYVFAAW